MRVLDLFSGIGGFSLGLERAGMETVAFCEKEDYPVTILNKHWPDVPVFRDVRKLDGRQFNGTADLVCGGVPCQPFSVAGKQKGQADDRHLWPDMLRIINECQPTWVIVENVVGFIKLALDDVCLDLENQGFATQSFIIPACAVGGLHKRERVWVVSYAEHNGLPAATQCRSEQEAVCRTPQGSNEAEQFTGICPASDVADPERAGLEGLAGPAKGQKGRAQSTRPTSEENISRNGQPIREPVEPAICYRADGVSRGLARDRINRLKALGNAVVPQIPELIGRAIMSVT